MYLTRSFSESGGDTRFPVVSIGKRAFVGISPFLLSEIRHSYDAQDLAKANAEKLNVTPVPSLNLVYTADEDYVTADYAKEKGLEIKKLSGTKFRQMLRGGEDIPEWFA